MGFLAGLYTLLLVAICLLQALLLYRTGKPAARQDDIPYRKYIFFIVPSVVWFPVF